jgi:orotidine-5'-phosphate decarboxylase
VKCVRFVDRLEQAASANRSRLCVGLDPVSERIQTPDLAGWGKALIAATADLVCCYKPNSAFYEGFGPEGWDALRETVAAVPVEIPVILDAKRADIGTTAEAYARAAFEVIGASAVTVNPYLGFDAIEPFLHYRDCAVFVLCRTSNRGAGEFQDLRVAVSGSDETRPLFEVVAEHCREWNQDGNVGLVAGATYPAELARIRSICPQQMLLVPGVGTQGGDLEASVTDAADSRGQGFILNASRHVIYAAQGTDYAAAARKAAAQLRGQIESARGSRT